MSTITTDIVLALDALQQGNLVAIPTETVYGLAANAEDESAIRDIFIQKNRPLNHPLIMHVAQDWDLSRWVSFTPDFAKTLIDHFWPGPLTLVMRCNPKTVSPLITGGQDTVALRCPKHPIAQQLLKSFGRPLVAPSANPFGKVSPTTALHVQDSFIDANLLILDGGRCQIGIESTILTAIDNDSYQILRHGMIAETDIRALLPKITPISSHSLRAPGQLDNHYQPQKPLYCFQHEADLEQFCEKALSPVCVFSLGQIKKIPPHHYHRLSTSSSEFAFELYYQLRQADQSSAHSIAIALPPDEAAWQGIREKLFKAALHCF